MSFPKRVAQGCAVQQLDGLPVVPRVPPLLARGAFFIDNLLVRIHFIIMMIRWTGLALCCAAA